MTSIWQVGGEDVVEHESTRARTRAVPGDGVRCVESGRVRRVVSDSALAEVDSGEDPAQPPPVVKKNAQTKTLRTRTIGED